MPSGSSPDAHSANTLDHTGATTGEPLLGKSDVTSEVNATTGETLPGGKSWWESGGKAKAMAGETLPGEKNVTSEVNATAGEQLPWNFTLDQIKRKDAPNNVKGS